MENDILDHKSFIDSQNKQIELANKLIENANGNKEVIEIAKKMIKSCEKVISIEQNMNHFIYSLNFYTLD